MYPAKEENQMTLKDWTLKTLTDYLEDIVAHGAAAGFPGITYYHDTSKLYDEYAEEIWDQLADDAEGFGHKHPLELVATFNGAKGVYTDHQFKNLLVWYYVEEIAREYTNR